jgi:hypothetical protein
VMEDRMLPAPGVPPAPRSIRPLLALLLLAPIAAIAIGFAHAAHAAPAYPLAMSSNGRYLVDQNNAPTLIVGDSPQALIVNVTEADAEMYLADRSVRGFNTLWVNLLCTTYTGGRPDGSTLEGILPFTRTLPASSTYDLEAPNETYFAHVDRIIDMAADHGLMILLDPIETGGWLTTMRDNGLTRCRSYGRFLGSRYRDFDNILWMSGNDFQGWRDPANDAVVREVAQGILETDPRHLHTLELDYLVSSSLDDPTWIPILGLNATYTYYPTYARLRHDYNRPYHLPTFMVEANYEFESLQGPVTTAPILRKQEYWTMTSGVTGQLYGNGYVWPFQNGWQQHLATPGAVQIGFMKTFFEPRAWWALVPDTSHVVVTAGYGTYSDHGYVADNNYLTAARTDDGRLVVAYTPVVRTFTVDMARLSAPATARWYDPSNGTYSTISGSSLPNAGSREFTPPGENGDGDGGWVLALETEPVEMDPPQVHLTSPADGATLEGTIQVSATATDSSGVAGVQFQVDSSNLGWEVLAPPYEVAWNTLTATNGPHRLTAIARDLTGNRGVDSVSVIVNNPIAPPPADHLALAYAFDEAGGSTLEDQSGNGNTGALHGATFASGAHGGALLLNGVNAYAEAPDSPSLDIGGTGLSVAFWTFINSTNSGVDYVIVGKPWFASAMSYPFYQYGVEYSNGYTKTLDFYFGDPSAGLHGPYRMSLTPGVWTHVTFTYDGSWVRGYLDGVQLIATAETSIIQPRHHSLRLGVDGAYQQFMNGLIDDLRIYSRALTSVEIQGVMQTPVGAPAGIPRGHGDGACELGLSVQTPRTDGAGCRISFALSAPGEMDLALYDISGRLVRTVAHGFLPAGPHEVDWDTTDAAGRRVAAGRYFLRLVSDGQEGTVPLVLIR